MMESQETEKIPQQAVSSDVPERIRSSLHWYDALLIGLPAIFCVAFFVFGDLWHTGQSSLAYLYGHIADFYDYNKVKMGGDDYYPLIYIIFAIWNIPLRLAGVATFTLSSFWTMIYEKFLPALFFACTAFPLYLIARRLRLCTKTSVYAVLLYLTTPIIFISTFAWGMYDSIYIFFLAFGIYFFLRDEKKVDLPLAMLLFGLSFSIKGVTLFVVAPMVLYRYKNLFKLAGCFILSLTPMLIQRLLYGGSPAFTGQAGHAGGYLVTLVAPFIDNGIFKTSLFFFTFALLCLFAYLRKYEEGQPIKLLYFGQLGAAAFLCLALWHPQWFIIIIRFLSC